ncbi:hypothetical protein U1Q18_026570 [Sarracenia purpurea var. burkii]
MEGMRPRKSENDGRSPGWDLEITWRSSTSKKTKHGDKGEGGGLLDVHEDGAESEAETLGDEDAEEEDEDEGGRRGFEATYPVDDFDEDGGDDELHRQVVDGVGK